MYILIVAVMVVLIAVIIWNSLHIKPREITETDKTDSSDNETDTTAQDTKTNAETAVSDTDAQNTEDNNVL